MSIASPANAKAQAPSHASATAGAERLNSSQCGGSKNHQARCGKTHQAATVAPRTREGRANGETLMIAAAGTSAGKMVAKSIEYQPPTRKTTR